MTLYWAWVSELLKPGISEAKMAVRESTLPLL